MQLEGTEGNKRIKKAIKLRKEETTDFRSVEQ